MTGKFAESAKKAGAATSRTLRRILGLPFGSSSSRSQPSPVATAAESSEGGNSDSPQKTAPSQNGRKTAVATPNTNGDASANDEKTTSEQLQQKRSESAIAEPAVCLPSSPTDDAVTTNHAATDAYGESQRQTAVKVESSSLLPLQQGADVHDSSIPDTKMTAVQQIPRDQPSPEKLPLQTREPTRNQENITAQTHPANPDQANDRNKENQPATTAAATAPTASPLEIEEALRKLGLEDDYFEVKPPFVPDHIELPPEVIAERAHHLRFIGEALDMARFALRINETPVGCVLVHNGKVIAKGMNATNVTRNGTRHAEAMALAALLSHPPIKGPLTTCLKPKQKPLTPSDSGSTTSSDMGPPDEGNEDGSKGHLYPYGQKMISEPRVNPAIVRECILYVTVEPCVMCASTLRQFGIKKVYFGAVNDKFGGTGGVFSIHANSLPVSADGQTKAAHPTPRPVQLPDGSGTLGTSYPPGGGDGGNVERGFEIEGGWGRDEAVGLLRRFYVQENGRAPVPRKKEGRAARLAAMIENDGKEDASVAGDETPGEQDEAGVILNEDDGLAGIDDADVPRQEDTYGDL